MKKISFFLIQLIAVFTYYCVLGQDNYVISNGEKYPIWYSKTEVLIKFKNLSKVVENNPSSFAKEAIRIDPIGMLEEMAFVHFEPNTTKAKLDSILLDLRKNENVILAHPVLVSESGERAAGFTDAIIVKAKKEVSTNLLLQLFDDYELQVKEKDQFSSQIYYLTGAQVFENPDDICSKLYQTGLFDFAQPNCLRFVSASGNPNDPLFGSNWGLPKMKLPDAWDITTGCSNIKIAIIDNGVQLDHPDLSANMLAGYDATGSGTNGGQLAGEPAHGTICAGIAAARGNNGTGVAGVAYNSKIIPVRAFGNTSSGDITTDQFIATAINHAVNTKNADVINLSFVIANATSYYSLIESALTNAETNGRGGKGSIIVAASGNAGSSQLRPLPANVGSVFMVGASTSTDTRWVYSNYGGSGNKLDVVAPGAKVSTTVGSTYVTTPTDIATSWAAPAVSGIAALILSVNPSLTAAQVRRIIAETSDKVGGYSYVVGNNTKNSDLSHNNEMGYGRVNALKALEKAAGAPITGPSLICTNGGYTLTAFPAGSSAVWSTTSGLSISGSTVTRQSGYSGSASIFATLTIPNACAPVTIKRNIWVGNPDLTKTINGVIAGTTPVSAGIQYNLAATSNSSNTTFNYNNYTGTGNMTIDLYSPNSPNTQMYVYSTSTSGSRHVRVTATNTCGSYYQDFVFYLSSGMMIAYPNPATNVLVLEFSNAEILDALPAQIEFYEESSTKLKLSVSPQQVYQDKAFKDENKIELDVSVLPRGTYYLNVIPGKNSEAKIERMQIILQ